MTKLTLSVCKAYKNSGRFRIHKENTSKHWKHYFIEDYFDDGDWKFSSEWVNPIQAQLLKQKIVHKMIWQCEYCDRQFEILGRKNSKFECPYCDE